MIRILIVRIFFNKSDPLLDFTNFLSFHVYYLIRTLRRYGHMILATVHSGSSNASVTPLILDTDDST
jgi:hypothetical protein